MQDVRFLQQRSWRFGSRGLNLEIRLDLLVQNMLKMSSNLCKCHITKIRKEWHYSILTCWPVKNVESRFLSRNARYVNTVFFFGWLAKWQKATINYITSLSVHVEHFYCHRTGFGEISCWGLIKYVEKIRSLLKSDKYTRHCTWRTKYVYISLNSSGNGRSLS